MDLFPVFVWIVIIFFVIRGVIQKNKENAIDWGNVGANIKNAQKVMKDVSSNNGAYGETTTAYHKVPSQDRASIKGTKEHLAQIQQRLQEKMENAGNAQTAAWGNKTKNNWGTSNTPSHKRNHVHSGNDYDRKKYSNKDFFKNDSVPVNVALRSCKPAVNKGWFDKGDRGPTVDRG